MNMDTKSIILRLRARPLHILTSKAVLSMIIAMMITKITGWKNTMKRITMGMNMGGKVQVKLRGTIKHSNLKSPLENKRGSKTKFSSVYTMTNTTTAKMSKIQQE